MLNQFVQDNKIENNESGRELPKNPLIYELASALGSMEEEFHKLIDLKDPELSSLLKPVIFSGGKRLRPLLVWLSAGLGDANPEKLRALMMAVELLHTASLVHDDILDDASVRRGIPTVYNQKGRRAAVHAGDYFLTLYASMMPNFFGTDINQALTETSRQMCLGELEQKNLLFDLKKQTEEAYFLQIRRKTAFLMSDCCYCGAVISNAPRLWQEALKQFGLYLGLAFQINDDILDFSGSARFGKSFGQDMLQGIFTLPILYAAEENPVPEMLALAEKRDKTQDDLEVLRDWVASSGGLSYSEKVAADLNDRALASLSCLPPGSIKGTLLGLAASLADRDK